MKQKVAIVEDEAAIAEMYRFKLEKSGYEVQYAVNGKKGLELAESFRPDLILLDLMMPEMNGAEMLEKVRATEWGRNIKVIILTNLSESEMASKLRLLGVSRYIVKAQYTPSEVVAVAAEVLAETSITK